ncbi:Arginase/deacetylase [Microstroma glucosiphilum]|uniref:Arginase/deacetylase n=1 Tax=Pseudomicrostroma glucosiphilum TaxID=1684307 RepID=A0A316U0B7_9BASI|nr:Arginase/deacetylase [Pseudomicrostroma glucosiphilum]PWN18856.1 Arginase/deacetylase [Pseudomicrostroma glucosiphilum]
MVFIVKIPPRSRRTTPEGQEQQQQQHQQQQEAMVEGTASIPGQWGEGSVSPPPTAARVQEQSQAVGTGQPAPAPALFAPNPPDQSEGAPLRASQLQNSQPEEQMGRSSSIQDALDALSMLSIGAGATAATQAVEMQPDRERSPAALAYPALPVQEVQKESQQVEVQRESQQVEVQQTHQDAPALTTPVDQLKAAPLLDIIVAPAVLAHRYIRGRDVSLIVERPERVRAVLLGVSALLGRMAEDNENRASSSARTAAAGNDADDLISQLQGMSMAGQRGNASLAGSPQVQVLHSTKSVPLYPAHPALAVVHAHQEEMVDDILPECEEKRRRKGKPAEAADGGAGQQEENQAAPSTLYSSYISQLCSYAPHSAPLPPQPVPRRTREAVSATATPTGLGRTRRATRQASPGPASSTATPLQKREEDIRAPFAQAVPTIKQEADIAGPMPGAPGPQTPAEEKREPVSFALPPTTPGQKLDTSTKEESSSSSSSSDDETDQHASEVPYHLSQGDLYLRGSKSKGLEDELAGYGSAEAIQHALAASIEAVDRVCAAADQSSLSKHNGHASRGSVSPLDFSSIHGGPSSSSSSAPLPSRRAFVLTRPPGHHCSGSAPSGFCWVNNAAVAAVHAYQAHGVDRVVIFDIDLHHGNGTQKIAWRINEETRRVDLERAARIKAAASSLAGRSGSGRGRGPRKSGGGGGGGGIVDVEAGIPPRGLQVFYSSLHDIESFPCEDGDAELVRDASVCIQGAHGQWIWNVHLDKYDSPSSFDELYRTKYSQLFTQARNFLESTGSTPSNTLVLISCGFDACSYELQGMQRHGKHVPPGFYERFARDAVQLSEEMAGGKVVSLLEGGYGDRALCSASIAHMKGLATPPRSSDGMSETQSRSMSEVQAPMATTSRHYSSVGSAMDPYAHQWFSLEALKALEKTMATVLRSRAQARTAAASGLLYPNGLTSGAGAGISPTKRRGGAAAAAAGQHALSVGSAGSSTTGQDWLARATAHFTAFEELCEPLMYVAPARAVGGSAGAGAGTGRGAAGRGY